MIVAGLDLGTNSFLCLVAKCSDRQFVELHDEARVVRLGQDMYQNGKKLLHAEALRRAEDCLKDFSSQAKSLGASKIYAVATSAARDAENSDQLFAICNKYGIELEVISGRREAELTFNGTFTCAEDRRGSLVVDVGGGSTEFLFQENGNTFAESLNIGAVRLTEECVQTFPTSKEEIAAIRARAKAEISKLKLETKISSLYAVAGTPTTLSAVIMKLDQFDKSKIDNFFLTNKHLHAELKRIASMNLDQRLKLPGMQKGREDILVAGICILIECLDYFGHEHFIVSTRGVRYGLVNELLD